MSYDKTALNDSLRYGYLSNKKNYNPLNKWFYAAPWYAKHSAETPIHHYLIRIFGSLILLKLGYELAIFETLEENLKFQNHKVV